MFLHNLFFALIIGLMSFAFKAEAGGDCRRLLSEVAHQIHFSEEIPANRRPIFIKATEKVRGLSQGLKPLPNLTFELTDMDGIAGGFAFFKEDKVKLTPQSLKLSDAALEDLLIHEITHFLVAKNFLIREQLYSAFTMYEFAQVTLSPSAHSQQLMEWYGVNANHAPYAELLCDVASVLLNRNPSTFADIIFELFINAEGDEQTLNFLKSIMIDEPFALRSFLWYRFIKDLPADQEAEFFAKLLNMIHKIYASHRLDQLTAIAGVKAANAALIELLQQDLLLDGQDPLNNAN